jgi:UDP-N-acetylmuramate dehydrogenase
MEVKENYSLKQLNTFGIDVNARYFVELKDDQDVIRFVREKFWKGKKYLILDGGSNVLFTGDFEGVVMKLSTKGIRVISQTDDIVEVNAKAGENWHDFVSWCISKNYGGLENLSLIPGNVGAAPIQNIGAYGVEQKDVFDELVAIEIATGKIRTFSKDECRFGYRNSVFKQELKNKYIILSVTYRLLKNPKFNISYGDLNRMFAGKRSEELTLKEIGDAVCHIRSTKLPDPEQIGNAGSFFKNPTISKDEYYDLLKKHPGLPGYPADQGQYKIAAGWMIDQLGWKGFRRGDAGVCETQALVLVNYGNAKGDEILELANEIKASVKLAFGLTLESEVNVVR